MAETNNVVTIEYNNAVMVTLAAGQKATLPCKDKSMSTDLVVSVPARLDSLMEELPATLKSNLLYHLDFDSESATGKFGNAIKLNDKQYTEDDYAGPGAGSFSASFWINIGGIGTTEDDPVLFTNKDWSSGNNPGYIFFVQNKDKPQLKFNVGNGEGWRSDLFFDLPADYEGEWVHVICVVDRTKGTVRVAFNFGAFTEQQIGGHNAAQSYDASALYIGRDKNGGYVIEQDTYMDDFMYFDRALTADDVIALEEYYFYSSGSVGGTDSALPIEVSTEAEMTALLESGEVGGVYKYTGTTRTYDNGALYVLADSSGNKFWRKLRFESEELYLTFSSPSSFTLNVVDNKKYWDGTLEYSTDLNTWNVWDGTTTLSADNGKLYMRGTGNTYITGYSAFESSSPIGAYWVLTGSDISCSGNIENLLDYATVASGRHPAMASYCYYSLFYGCTSLVTAPKIPATEIMGHCYFGMFEGCTSLTIAPQLPATTLAPGSYDCYSRMFKGCTSLTKAPELPATTLVYGCYSHMFNGCTSLTTAPELPATTLANDCYYGMFYGCTSITTAPELPATTLAIRCYDYMFGGCTSLTTVPELPATTLADYCYYCMFYSCTSIKLSATQSEEYPTPYRIPTSGTGTTATGALYAMFTGTGGTFKNTSEINTTYYLHTSNSVV